MYKLMTGQEIHEWLYRPGYIVCFACRKGRAEGMPYLPVDAWRPSKKARLLYGMVSGISEDKTRIRVEDGSGGSGWVLVEDVLIQVDEL